MPSPRSQSETILIIDVQSRFVRGSLVTLNFKKKPSVLFVADSDILFKSNMDSSDILKNAVDSIEMTIKSILQFARTNPNVCTNEKMISVHVVLSSPWALPQTKIKKIIYPKITSITKKSVLKIIEGDNAVSANADNCVIETKILDVRLNGYQVSDWDNKNASELELSYIKSISGIQTINLFSQACKNQLNGQSISFHSSLFLQHLGLEQGISRFNSYTLIHVHGELTDVAVVKDQICILFGSFPTGTDTIMRKISETSKTDEHATESLLTLYSQNNLDTSLNRYTIDAISGIADSWIKEFQKLALSISERQNLISPVIIESNKHIEYFSHIFKRTYQQANVISIGFDELTQYVGFGQGITRSYFAGLYSIALNALLSRNLL